MGSPMDYVAIPVRIVTVMGVLLLMTLLVGRRQVGELPVFDFAVAITIGSVAGADIADLSIPHLPTVYAVFVMTLLQIIFSRYIIGSRKFGKMVTFEPVVVIQEGRLLKRNLRKIRYSLDMLMYQLRQNNVFSLQEVEYAVIEPNGGLSVQKKSFKRPVTTEDLGLTPKPASIALPVIADGRVFTGVLDYLAMDYEDLLTKLREEGYSSPQGVFYASLEDDKTLYVAGQEEQLKGLPLRL